MIIAIVAIFGIPFKSFRLLLEHPIAFRDEVLVSVGNFVRHQNFM